MTTRQAILDAIALYRECHGYAPTVEELRHLAGISSKSVVHYHLEQLKAAGAVTWEPGKSRTLRVMEKAQ